MCSQRRTCQQAKTNLKKQRLKSSPCQNTEGAEKSSETQRLVAFTGTSPSRRHQHGKRPWTRPRWHLHQGSTGRFAQLLICRRAHHTARLSLLHPQSFWVPSRTSTSALHETYTRAERQSRRVFATALERRRRLVQTRNWASSLAASATSPCHGGMSPALSFRALSELSPRRVAFDA